MGPSQQKQLHLLTLNTYLSPCYSTWNDIPLFLMYMIHHQFNCFWHYTSYFSSSLNHLIEILSRYTTLFFDFGGQWWAHLVHWNISPCFRAHQPHPFSISFYILLVEWVDAILVMSWLNSTDFSILEQTFTHDCKYIMLCWEPPSTTATPSIICHLLPSYSITVPYVTILDQNDPMLTQTYIPDIIALIHQFTSLFIAPTCLPPPDATTIIFACSLILSR